MPTDVERTTYPNMTLAPRFKETFKTALAMVLAYGVAPSMDGEKPMLAAFAVAFISLATAGQSVNKGALRMLETLPAAPARSAFLT